jgi:hypothetical protein
MRGNAPKAAPLARPNLTIHSDSLEYELMEAPSEQNFERAEQAIRRASRVGLGVLAVEATLATLDLTDVLDIDVSAIYYVPPALAGITLVVASMLHRREMRRMT